MFFLNIRLEVENNELKMFFAITWTWTPNILELKRVFYLPHVYSGKRKIKFVNENNTIDVYIVK